MNTPYRNVFKRMETDAEYRKRCCGHWCRDYKDAELDAHVENIHGSKRNPMQRRIIEDVS
jgi:hypothetical protein